MNALKDEVLFYNKNLENSDITDIDLFDSTYTVGLNDVESDNRKFYLSIIDTQRIRFKHELLELLKNSLYEYGFSSAAEDFIRLTLEENATYCREWINEVYLENVDNEYMIVTLLRVISHFEYAEVYPVGMTIAAAALSHKSNMIKENAIRAFENWEDPKNIKLLETLDCKESSLKEYLEQVIQDLKEYI